MCVLLRVRACVRKASVCEEEGETERVVSMTARVGQAS